MIIFFILNLLNRLGFYVILIYIDFETSFIKIEVQFKTRPIYRLTRTYVVSIKITLGNPSTSFRGVEEENAEWPMRIRAHDGTQVTYFRLLFVLRAFFKTMKSSSTDSILCQQVGGETWRFSLSVNMFCLSWINAATEFAVLIL